ncbi:MAG: hypothetical protein ACOX7D_00790 [Alphaproteobacteria bacterium]|jgi:hypothetical protein
MRKMFLLFTLVGLIAIAGCCNCEYEPIVKENQALIIPPNFGNKPK